MYLLCFIFADTAFLLGAADMWDNQAGWVKSEVGKNMSLVSKVLFQWYMLMSMLNKTRHLSQVHDVINSFGFSLITCIV